LAVIVLIFVVVDFIILITVTAIDGVRYIAKNIRDPENPAFVNVSLILVDTLCNSAFIHTWYDLRTMHSLCGVPELQLHGVITTTGIH